MLPTKEALEGNWKGKKSKREAGIEPKSSTFALVHNAGKLTSKAISFELSNTTNLGILSSP